jgi:hypothetical protein
MFRIGEITYNKVMAQLDYVDALTHSVTNYRIKMDLHYQQAGTQSLESQHMHLRTLLQSARHYCVQGFGVRRTEAEQLFSEMRQTSFVGGCFSSQGDYLGREYDVASIAAPVTGAQYLNFPWLDRNEHQFWVYSP